MYSTLKEKMPNVEFIYGPMTKEEAFSVPVHSYATTVGNDWYAGTNEEVPELADKLIPAPEVPPEEPAPAE